MNNKEECKVCVKTTCRMHPKYQAKRQPRCSCEVCWEIWKRKQKELQNETLD